MILNLRRDSAYIVESSGGFFESDADGVDLRHLSREKTKDAWEDRDTNEERREKRSNEVDGTNPFEVFCAADGLV